MNDIVLFNNDGIQTDTGASIDRVHQEGLLHGSVRVYFLDTQNKKVALQLRSSSSFQYPLFWDATVGGHIDVGDSPLTTALKESEEEVGVDILEENLEFYMQYEESIEVLREDMHEGFDGVYKDNVINFVYVYTVDDANDLKLKVDHTEVSKITWVSLEDLEGVFARGILDTRKVVPGRIEQESLCGFLRRM